ncbi:putative uncharacterized protein [Bacteroides thetaiotaomicron CAG:40]|jgi:phage FluMu protein Com|nr:putative uncharacterized protein [Bacteroides thetaiotaomicron CAG:40]
MGCGFIITKLKLKGNSLPSAEIQLESGVNIITGPTNTGKSYIFECINYMLGSSKKARDIKEARLYSNIFLEIKINNHEIYYTLESDFKGGDFKLYKEKVDNIGLSTEYEFLKRKHEPRNEKTISAFLLGLNNLYGKKIRTNAKGKTREISYRDVVRYLMINEERIITKDSLIVSGQYSKATEEINALKLIVTGCDDNNIIEQISEKEITQRKGKIDLLKEFISNINHSIEENDLKYDVDKEIETTNNNLTALYLKHRELNKTIQELYDKKNTFVSYLSKIESKFKNLSELSFRSDILHKQYISDKERLEATIESCFLFVESDSTEKKCPLCSNLVVDVEISEKEITSIAESCKIESQKISLLISELYKSQEIINEERDLLDAEIRKIRNDIIAVDNDINNILNRDINYISESIRKFNNHKEYLLQVKEKRSQLDFYLKLQNKISTTITSPQGKFAIDLTTASTTKLSEYIKNILESCHYPNISSVAYSEDKKDFVISGEDRALEGKGLRAITYSAFIIALQELISQSDYSLGTPILDSPLVTYRKPKAEGEGISMDVAMEFYRYLADSRIGNQIIILENEEPPTDISDKINHIIFTGSEVGRKGFIPQ